MFFKAWEGAPFWGLRKNYGHFLYMLCYGQLGESGVGSSLNTMPNYEREV